MKCFAIRDEEAGLFLTPFFVRSVVDAIRSVSNVLRDPNSNLTRFYQDFRLYELGELDVESGQIKPAGPTVVCEVGDVLNRMKGESLNGEQTGIPQESQASKASAG